MSANPGASGSCQPPNTKPTGEAAQLAAPKRKGEILAEGENPKAAAVLRAQEGQARSARRSVCYGPLGRLPNSQKYWCLLSGERGRSRFYPARSPTFRPRLGSSRGFFFNGWAPGRFAPGKQSHSLGNGLAVFLFKIRNCRDGWCRCGVDDLFRQQATQKTPEAGIVGPARSCADIHSGRGVNNATTFNARM